MDPCVWTLHGTYGLSINAFWQDFVVLDVKKIDFQKIYHGIYHIINIDSYKYRFWPLAPPLGMVTRNMKANPLGYLWTK